MSRGTSLVEEEVHLAGIVVYAGANFVAQVAAQIAAIPGARVHAASESGKLVVTLEAASSGEMAGCTDRIRKIPGVVDTAMVYQHAESLASMNEEISDETHA